MVQTKLVESQIEANNIDCKMPSSMSRI